MDSPETVHSDSVLKDHFIHGAARAFFACAYGDYYEDEDVDVSEEVPSRTPPAAYALAGELWGTLAALNRATAPCGVISLIANAAKADVRTIEDHEAEDFGHYVAMQAMGHGVSWFDSHAEFPMEVPRMECSLYTFDEAAYKED